MIEKDTRVTLTDSVILGEPGNVITIRSTGAGNGRLSLNNSTMEYANVKLALPFTTNSNSKVDRSDLSFNGDGQHLYGLTQNSFIASSSYWYNSGTIDHSYYSGNYFYNRKTIRSSYLGSTSEVYNYGGQINSSYAKRVHSNEGSSFITDSVVSYLSGGSSSSAIITGSDVQLSSGISPMFFDNTYIANSSGTSFYDGYGLPIDQLGDGVAATVFTIDGSTYTVDGINQPRSTKNFPNGVGDLWNPEGVGALWNPNAADPTIFPESAP